MNTPMQTIRSERGYVLVASLVTLLLLTVLGIWASRSTQTELRMARNERLHQEAFYQADAATHLTERLIYHNALCSNLDFTDLTGVRNATILDEGKLKPLIQLNTEKTTWMGMEVTKGGNMWQAVDICLDAKDQVVVGDASDHSKKAQDCATLYDAAKHEPTETNYTFRYHPDGDLADLNKPHTYVLVGARTRIHAGQGLEQNAGYADANVGARDAVYWTYKIKSRHVGNLGSESQVNSTWRLSGLSTDLGREEDCRYGTRGY